MTGRPALIPALLTLAATLLGQPGPAQETGHAEREVMYRRYLAFASHVRWGSIEPHWMADGSSFWYAEGAPDRTVIWKVDPRASARKTPLLDAVRLRRALAPLLGHEPPYQGLPFESFTFVRGEKAVQFTVEKRDFLIELDSYAVTALPALSAAERDRREPRVVRSVFPVLAADVVELPSPDRRWFALDDGENLWLRSSEDGRRVQLTSDGVKNLGWSVGGARWSPDGKRLAAFRVDNRKVHFMPVVHWLKPEEEVEWLPYPFGGADIPHRELFVFDILSRHQTQIDLGNDQDRYLRLVGWKNDGAEIFLYRLDRGMKQLDLLAANPTSGKTRVILTERQKTFIEGLRFDEVANSFFTLLDDGQRFLWLSERDGWTHLYLYDLHGRLIRRLTSGSFPVVRVVAVDEAAGWIYLTAQGEPTRPYDTHLYRVDLEGNHFTRLTEGPGQHNPRISPSKQFLVDGHSSSERPPSVELRRADGGLQQVLAHANVDGLKDLRWRPPEEFVVKAADGTTDLYGVLYKPFDFDPARKYPAIDLIYAGAQSTFVPRTFIPGPRAIQAQALAQLGFVVFIVDARGTPGRGKAFQDVAYHSLGRHEIPDHVAALRGLTASRPYIDLNRVGVHGYSWGGYFALRAMLLAPEVYHVGVSSAPIVEFASGMPQPIEPYMGLPQDNPDGYEYASNLKLAGNLKGKLLLTIGTSDVNTPFAHTIKMVEALVRAGKPHDLVVLPEQNHVLTGAGLEYWRDAVRRYFVEHLKP